MDLWVDREPRFTVLTEDLAFDTIKISIVADFSDYFSICKVIILQSVISQDINLSEELKAVPGSYDSIDIYPRHDNYEF